MCVRRNALVRIARISGARRHGAGPLARGALFIAEVVCAHRTPRRSLFQLRGFDTWTGAE